MRIQCGIEDEEEEEVEEEDGSSRRTTRESRGEAHPENE